MGVALKSVASLIIAASFVSQVMASEALIGNYEGKIKDNDGYSGQTGDACTVKIAKTGGGGISFAISNMETIEFDSKTATTALDATGPDVKLVSPAMGMSKDLEIAFMKLRQDGAPLFLKLVRSSPVQHSQKSVVCSELVKK